MTREEATNIITKYILDIWMADGKSIKDVPNFKIALEMAINALEQEPCEDVCERFEQSIDIVADIVEFRFSDGTVKRAKRGLYMRDIEESLRKMLIDQMANEKKQEPCDDAISRKAVIEITAETGALETQARVKALPPVTPQPMWIPTSEKLPEKGMPVIWLMKYGDIDSDYYGMLYDRGRKYPEFFIAWMPFPEIPKMT